MEVFQEFMLIGVSVVGELHGANIDDGKRLPLFSVRGHRQRLRRDGIQRVAAQICALLIEF
eukprot:5049615-Prorocentrum_lima.AAC.1